MNYKQKVFVEEYLIDFNATQAAIRAGYSERTARSIGSENLTKPDIKEEIEARIAERVMSADEALAELSDIAHLDVADFLEFKPGIEEPYLDLRGAKEAGLLKLVRKIKYSARGRLEIEFCDKQAAIVQVGKWQGLTERTELTGAGGKPIEIKGLEDAARAIWGEEKE